MRRTASTLLAAVLLAGLGVGAAHGAKAKKVGSDVEIEWYDGSGDASSLFGDVHSMKNKCERKRKVTLEVDGQSVGTDATDRTGDWSIVAKLDVNAPFVASVEKRTIGGGDKKLVCKAAQSPPFIVEA